MCIEMYRCCYWDITDHCIENVFVAFKDVLLLLHEDSVLLNLHLYVVTLLYCIPHCMLKSFISRISVHRLYFCQLLWLVINLKTLSVHHSPTWWWSNALFFKESRIGSKLLCLFTSMCGVSFLAPIIHCDFVGSNHLEMALDIPLIWVITHR